MPFPALKPGYRLDRYELLGQLAEGGMAHVWLARMQGKRGFEKLVAIKTIKPEYSNDPSFETMFLDEARIASMVQHPNVAQIIDLGEQSGLLYLVLEYIDGESLSRLRMAVSKQGHAFPTGVALRILADTCAGLHAAHELRDERGQPLGAIHRDVSPQNILVSTGGAIKLIDFGIAKAANRMLAATGAGTFKGKIHYMPPEQALGGAMDRRVDVWATGAVLYYLLTGRKPYDPLKELDVIRRLATGTAPPHAEDQPEIIHEILMHCLAPDPKARFGTASALQRAMESALAQLGPTTSEDVARCMEQYLGDAAEKRRQFVQVALERAAQRPPGTQDDKPIVNERPPPSADPPTQAGYDAPKAPLPAAGMPPRPKSPTLNSTQYAPSPPVSQRGVDLKATQYAQVDLPPPGQRPSSAQAPTFPAALHAPSSGPESSRSGRYPPAPGRFDAPPPASLPPAIIEPLGPAKNPQGYVNIYVPKEAQSSPNDLSQRVSMAHSPLMSHANEPTMITPPKAQPRKSRTGLIVTLMLLGAVLIGAGAGAYILYGDQIFGDASKGPAKAKAKASDDSKDEEEEQPKKKTKKAADDEAPAASSSSASAAASGSASTKK